MLTNEWTDGVLSSVFRDICADDKPDQKWIVFDGKCRLCFRSSLLGFVLGFLPFR